MISVMTKQQIYQLIAANQDKLREFGVLRCGLFGSFVRDEAVDQSDVDMLVVFDPSLKTFHNFMDLCFFLEDLFGRKVDVVTPESLSPFIGGHILQEVEYVPFS